MQLQLGQRIQAPFLPTPAEVKQFQIGELLPDTRPDELLRDVIFSQRRLEEIEQHIEAVDAGTG